MTSSIDRRHVGARLSETAIYNGTVYLAGQIAEDDSADIVGQTRQVLDAIDALLAQAGSDKDHLLNATIYLKDIGSGFAPMNDVWSAWLSPGMAPTRTTLQAELARPNVLVEISVIAVRK